jgi:hypothetical protein
MNKTPYIMFDFPTQDYAIRYCTENGLILGNTYFIIEQPDEHNVFIRISDDKNTLVGKTFFKQHFKIDLRTINLDKLI